MNKIFPPVLILLDVVFVILFALALKPDKVSVKIKFPLDAISMKDIKEFVAAVDKVYQHRDRLRKYEKDNS